MMKMSKLIAALSAGTGSAGKTAIDPRGRTAGSAFSACKLNVLSGGKRGTFWFSAGNIPVISLQPSANIGTTVANTVYRAIQGL
jgi:hypothetical protein